VTASGAETILNRNQIKREKQKGQMRELAPLAFESKRAQLFFPFLFFPAEVRKGVRKEMGGCQKKKEKKKKKTWC
jgi:hypothetical protein